MKNKINKTLIIVTITMALAASAAAQTDLTSLFEDYPTDDLFVNTTPGNAVILDSVGCPADSFALDSHYDINFLDPVTEGKDSLNVNSENATLLPEPTTVMMLGMGGLVFIRRK